LTRASRRDDEIKTALDYLRPYSHYWTFTDVVTWLRHRRQKESAIAMTPPRWSALGIDRQLSLRPRQREPEKKRSDRSAKCPIPPESPSPPLPPQGDPIISLRPSDLEQVPESHSLDIPVVDATADATDFTALVEPIVLSFLRRQPLAMDDDHLAPSEMNRALVHLVCEQTTYQLERIAHELAIDIAMTCRGEIGILRIARAQQMRPGHLERARAARALNQDTRCAQFHAAGLRLMEFRRAAMARVSVESEIHGSIHGSMNIAHFDHGIGILDSETAGEDYTLRRAAGLSEAYRDELVALWRIPPQKEKRRRYSTTPLSLQFAFLLACFSCPALDLSRNFLPIPTYRTTQNHYGPIIARLIHDLSDLEALDHFIEFTLATHAIPPGADVSLAIDAIAFSPDRKGLNSTGCDNAFVFYIQPLDATLKCFPVHVMNHTSGRATSPVQDTLQKVSQSIRAHGLILRYVCADGDCCYHRRHLEYFQRWYEIFIENGLGFTLNSLEHDFEIPVGDYLHIWKVYCNKVKNHPVTLVPSSAESSITVDDLEALFHLGPALLDRSTIGRMRDSYPLQLFCWANCVKCIEKRMMHEFMYLLPWTLQEEVLRSPKLTREERLRKAILRFKLLLHYFDLSHLRCGPGVQRVSKRFVSGRTVAVTFAEDSVWPVLLNTALVLVRFILQAEENWSFSRIGTHCLENFFGLIRRESFGDDRYVVATRIIAKASLVSRIMHDLGIAISHRGRDNVGGTLIRGSKPEFGEEDAMTLFRSLIHIAALEFHHEVEAEYMPIDALEHVLLGWLENDHHEKDPTALAQFTGKPANARISARIIARPTECENPPE
jgi:hypothetical protein